MEIREFLKALRAGWMLVVGAIALGLVAAGALNVFATPLYTAQTQLFVSTTGASTTSDVFQGSQFSQERVASYARLLGGEELARRVIAKTGVALSADALSKEIVAQAVPDTVLLDVAVTDPSPSRAQQLAGAVAQEFILTVGSLEAEGPDGTSPVKVTVTEPARLPIEPSSPAALRNLVVGGLIGATVGCLGAVGRVRLDRSVRDPKEASGLGGSPVIGTIFKDDGLAKRHVIDRTGSARSAEDYRQLRTSLQFIDVDHPPRVIMVSSPMPSEGKTTVVVNLALALAEAGNQVVIVEADLRRPRVTRYLGMVGGVGLTNILAGSAELADVIQPYGDGAVSVVGAGPTPPNPSQLLASAHMSTLIEQLREKYDFVLIDVPPLLPVADSAGLAVMVDGVLLSVRYGDTKKEQLSRAVETLDRVGAKTLGLILNIVPPRADVSGSYGYGYSYASDREGGARRLRRQDRKLKTSR